MDKLHALIHMVSIAHAAVTQADSSYRQGAIELQMIRVTRILYRVMMTLAHRKRTRNSVAIAGG